MQKELLSIGDHRVEAAMAGAGKPFVFLHGSEHFAQNYAFLRQAALQWRVLAPRHPGFGASPLPAWMRSVDDLAYFYLDCLEALDLREILLVGCSFGGWIASEIAIRSAERLAGLVLIDTVGCKFDGPQTREIADVYALSEQEVLRRTYANPEEWAPNYAELPEAEVAEIVHDRVTLTRFGWRPYMHNPNLSRWLHRISVPTTVIWGERDGIVTPDYGRNIAKSIPDARFVSVPDAGHHPQVEKPQEIMRQIRAFSEESAPGKIKRARN